MAFTFSQKVKTIIRLLREPKNLSAIISQREFGYLLEVGRFESFKSLKSIDKNRKPISWLIYPFIDFLTPDYRKRSQYLNSVVEVQLHFSMKELKRLFRSSITKNGIK